MPKNLRTKLEEAAGESGRSVNAEIIHRLQSSFRDSPLLRRVDVVEIVRLTIEELKAAERAKK